MESQLASVSRFCFGGFEADLRSGELRRSGSRIKLQEQPFQILAALLERPGEVVTREELRKRLWPAGIHLDFENGLNIAVKKLRQALDDDSETPRFIETLPKRGYRFIAPVQPVVPPPSREPSAPVSSDRESPTPASASASVANRASRNAILMATAIVLALGVAFVWRAAWENRAGNPPIRSLAVLPLQNLSGDPAQDYFADGMTEELITDLAQLHGLRVISRTSSMLYRRPHKPVPEIGRELDVDAVIEGAVVRSGGRVRITAQLIDAAADRHLWAASYEQDLRDVLGAQDRVARAIADAVRVQLTPQERQRLARIRPVNPAAYEAYLKGRYYAYKLSNDGIRKGEDYFREAIRIDPGYAPAYTGIAYVWFARSGWTASPHDANPKIKAAAETAIRLDPALAEAHADLGIVHFWYDWDWAAAEREFRRAIALNPNNQAAHEFYGESLAWAGKAEQGIAEGKRALSLDPVSTEAARVLGEDYYFSHRFAAAIAQLRETVSMDPGYWFAHVSLGRAYLYSGHTREAVAELEIGARFAPDNPDGLASLGDAYAIAGMLPKAKDVLVKLQTLASRGAYVAPYHQAIVYLGLGDKTRALELLEDDFRQRSLFVSWWNTDPALDPLRSDPRFRDLARKSPLFVSKP